MPKKQKAMYNIPLICYNNNSFRIANRNGGICMGFLVCIVGISIIAAIVAAMVSSFTGALIGAEEFDDED